MTGRLVVVSNRLPDNPTLGSSSVGGLVSALVPAIADSGSALWFGWSGRTVAGTERLAVKSQRAGQLRTIAIDLSPGDVEGYYNSFGNGALWPLLHSFPERFSANERDYARYRNVNA